MEAATSLAVSNMPLIGESAANKESSSCNCSNSFSSQHANLQNMSPGYTFYVFHKLTYNDNRTGVPNRAKENDMDEVVVTPKVWGLVTQPGTVNNPIAPGPNKHFSNMMFNARSEEAASKFSFGKLIQKKQSCVISLDGFYEWKTQSTTNKKQPYFVYTKSHQPMCVAGLYTSVPVGGPPDEKNPMLSTFTIFTTKASPQLSWLHSRMPLILSAADALEWIHNPTPALLAKLSCSASGVDNSSGNNPKLSQLLSWHPVTQKMNSSSYKGFDCMEPVQLDTAPSITSFFLKKGPTQINQLDKKAEYVSAPTSSTYAVPNTSDDNDTYLTLVEERDHITPSILLEGAIDNKTSFHLLDEKTAPEKKYSDMKDDKKTSKTRVASPAVDDKQRCYKRAKKETHKKSASSNNKLTIKSFFSPKNETK